MKINLPQYVPPVGFFYSVQILGEGAPPSPPMDGAFQEVSGISVNMETESIKEGGQNRFAHKVPGRTSYGDLVLKRGLMVKSSGLADWCKKTLEGDLSQKIEPKTIKVILLEAMDENPGGLMSWKFVNAYPIKWELSSLDAQKSEFVIESITFTYSYFDRETERAAAAYPKTPRPKPAPKKKAQPKPKR
ncbi:phage tail protein [Lewinella sp. W8]|uniref:phage tail protein n=1 Tax=Lewinella sp. W8 TaxID=2528208 RepID=UPI00106773AA|nr:phage tail protein [Lewinella sp. W8]MTB52942.1 phage tail protein [Lewinella sp. W8]